MIRVLMLLGEARQHVSAWEKALERSIIVHATAQLSQSYLSILARFVKAMCTRRTFVLSLAARNASTAGTVPAGFSAVGGVPFDGVPA